MTYPNWLIDGLQPRSNGQTETFRRPWPTAAKFSTRGGSTVANACLPIQQAAFPGLAGTAQLANTLAATGVAAL